MVLWDASHSSLGALKKNLKRVIPTNWRNSSLNKPGRYKKFELEKGHYNILRIRFFERGKFRLSWGRPITLSSVTEPLGQLFYPVLEMHYSIHMVMKGPRVMSWLCADKILVTVTKWHEDRKSYLWSMLFLSSTAVSSVLLRIVRVVKIAINLILSSLVEGIPNMNTFWRRNLVWQLIMRWNLDRAVFVSVFDEWLRAPSAKFC